MITCGPPAPHALGPRFGDSLPKHYATGGDAFLALEGASLGPELPVSFERQLGGRGRLPPPEDSAPSASPVRRKARATPAHPGA